MNLDYDELRRIYRLEKNTSKLVDIEEDFYNALLEFVSAEKRAYLDSLKDISTSKSKDFLNLKKMVSELFALRQKKIVNNALVAVRTGDDANLERLAAQERELYTALCDGLSRHQALFDEIFTNHDAPKPRQRDLQAVSVTLLKEVPAFVGTDLKEYGPYQSGQTASLPYKVAKLLLAKSMAELGEPE